MMTTPDDAAYLDARRRVRAQRDFYQHVIVYAAVISMLFLINVATTPNWWVQWPAMGWASCSSCTAFSPTPVCSGPVGRSGASLS